MQNKNIRKVIIYIIGLFIMAIGIGLSVKSNLGVSPVSTIPYTITLTLGIEMGRATVLFYIVLVLIQILILRKNFKIINLAQIVVAVGFGYFTTFSNELMSFFPDPHNYIFRLLFLFTSILCVALGILLYMSSGLIPLAGEGVMKAVSLKTKIDFSKCKLGFDITMVVISTVVCFSVLNQLGSVREGTLISAIFVGVVLEIFTKCLKDKINKFINGEVELA
ncbi:YitT family protein [Clostridium butyricum]|jgi:uncharacterized membrane protein YczE|uniref:Membrane protein n=1 Tax=Clostridium butyricum TaxID=1492 RepID=A0A512TK06_CLOBU|nr:MULTISPECIES: DUF6198 family protein [Clostridium]ETI87496.1 MAG: hypothetical protein Q607_CBUC00216G0017 [Clostridium butyricum DORA_1]ENZ32072.1 hypothetical protein HMPREF1084_02486 [Clostridium butyricum 60E.3]MBZ0313841.1 DUF6198 family protein [Clostridium butyricum]MDB2138632.1 DUF6198 family protein [Clostridium butyricum]MDB2155595.1 DUF6198 family protein [Clostridium butyricum]